MPELPEVETVANSVHARVHGDRIVEVWFGSHREPFKTPPARQARGLEGRILHSIHRTGKHIVCELADRDTPQVEKQPQEKRAELLPQATSQWIVHLGMTGRLLVTTPDAPVEPHTHARLLLKSGKEIRFVDPRRFGRLEFRDLTRGEGFAAAGAEPLTIGPEDFAVLFRGRKLAIKAALLNQTLLSGVGNIYADESLFRAGIRPRRQAGRLTRAELERLRAALQQVLRHAIQLGGSSVADYVDADGVRGFFQLEHCVYQRAGQPCRQCGASIRRITVAGRSTHYCPNCQH
jgi:formamidopyrimidine-DNA glycosylase